MYTAIRLNVREEGRRAKIDGVELVRYCCCFSRHTWRRSLLCCCFGGGCAEGVVACCCRVVKPCCPRCSDFPVNLRSDASFIDHRLVTEIHLQHHRDTKATEDLSPQRHEIDAHLRNSAGAALVSKVVTMRVFGSLRNSPPPPNGNLSAAKGAQLRRRCRTLWARCEPPGQGKGYRWR